MAVITPKSGTLRQDGAAIIDVLTMPSDWPAAVSAIYDKYVGIVGEMAMDYGPAHVVWADGNFSDTDIAFCIAACDGPKDYDLSPEVKAVVRESLVELSRIPESERLGAA